jgi:RNA polymerase sigma-B factor
MSKPCNSLTAPDDLILDECDPSSTGGEVVKLHVSNTVERHNEELIEEYQRTRNVDILQKILTINDGLVHAVLKRFPYFPDPYEDIVQVARLGMIKAVQRFDTDRGVEFSSYATSIVDGEVRHYLRDNTLMRQPRWLRKSEKRIEEASIELSRKLNRAPTLEELSRTSNITTEGILEILKVRSQVSLYSIDDPVSRNDFQPDLDHNSIGSLRFESFSLPVEDEIMLHEAYQALSVFQKKLVYMLFYKDLTQTEVAKQLGMTQRKVSREVNKALGMLKTALNTKIF